ncbi:MAG: NAD(+) kinase [Actinobacteria bacterium]|nr:NAD(+) kinase [Actinomycetota bacterium]
MKIGIVGNTHKPKVRPAIADFVSFLKKRQIPVIYAQSLIDFIGLDASADTVHISEMGAECNVVVVFGGDGTFLSTAKEIASSNVPILGVNMGGLGFLAEIVIEELEETVDCLIRGDYSVIERMVLEGKFHKDDKVESFYALNDFVVDKGSNPRLLFIDVQVDGVFLNTYRSDGVIISTPTGSTAYSLSAGGPLLVPTLKAIIVTPICPHSLTVRPIVLADDSVLHLSISPDQAPAHVHFDGRGRSYLRPGDWIEIKKADYSVKWLSIGKRDFYEIMRTKLNWGVDLPAMNKNKNLVENN